MEWVIFGGLADAGDLASRSIFICWCNDGSHSIGRLPILSRGANGESSQGGIDSIRRFAVEAATGILQFRCRRMNTSAPAKSLSLKKSHQPAKKLLIWQTITNRKLKRQPFNGFVGHGKARRHTCWNGWVHEIYNHWVLFSCQINLRLYGRQGQLRARIAFLP